MTSYVPEKIDDYIARLKQSNWGIIHTIRIRNKKSMPVTVQIEPTGDIAPPLQPDDSYDVVLQSQEPGLTIIELSEDWISAWVDEGQVFHNGVSVAY